MDQTETDEMPADAHCLVTYRDSSGGEVFVKNGEVHLVSPALFRTFNAAHLASFINGLIDAHSRIVGAEKKD